MASISPNTNVLGAKNAKHLLRRSSFVYTKSLIDKFSELTPKQALDLLFEDTDLVLKLPYDPLPLDSPDGFWTESPELATLFSNQARKASIVSAWWWYNAVNTTTIKFKISHFLSTRFTVQKSNGAGSATEFYDYLSLLLHYSFGSYKTLAKKITLNNSMLNYLNNSSNSKLAPNENYAREFLELFTIGKGNQIDKGNYTNYTEVDVVQAAKVLTGFKRESDRSFIDKDTGIPKGKNVFSDHDTSSKIFSSAFNNTIISPASDNQSMDAELDDFIEMIFKSKETAKTICRKIYIYFVSSNISEEVENEIIIPLSNDLIQSEYNLEPVVRKLLESTHFYDLDDADGTDEKIGALIKSPLQQLTEICTFLEAKIPNPETEPFSYYISFWNDFVHNSYMRGANMVLFDPQNVAGHPAYYQQPNFDKNWVSASTLIYRYKLGESLIYGENRFEENTKIGAKITFSEVLRYSKVITVVDDPYILTSELCNALFGQETDEERIKYFMNTFLLQGQPPGDWTSLWGFYIEANFNSVVDLRLNSLLTNILRAPETQMF